MVAACKRTDYKIGKITGHSSFLTGEYVRVPGDEYGFFVIAEADNESHGIQTQYLKDNSWENVVEQWNKRIADKELTLKLTDAAMDHVIEAGYDPHYGARPLKRYLQKNVETLVAKSILSNELRAGDTITLDYDGNALYIKK